MMAKRQSFWFFINEKTERVKVSYTDLGALLIAFNDEDAAARHREDYFRDSIVCRLDDLDMTEFLRVILGNPMNKGIKGILLNPPKTPADGSGFMPNDIILDHLFLAEEMDL